MRIKVYIWKQNETYKAVIKYPQSESTIWLNQFFQSDGTINERINNWNKHYDIIVGMPPG